MVQVAAFPSLRVVMLPDTLDAAHACVTVVMPQVLADPAFDGVCGHFERGNARTPGEPCKRFVEGPMDRARVREPQRNAADKRDAAAV